MKIELEALGKQRYRVRGEIDFETLRRERLRRARAYAPYVQVKGFRPGHVPPDIVARHIGPALDEEAREAVARQALADVAKERSLSPTFDPDIRFEDTGADGSVSFTAEFEALPTLDPKDYLGVEVPELDLPPVTDDDVEAGLKQFQETRVSYEERPADSVAHEGDLARCEIVFKDAATGEVLKGPGPWVVIVGLSDEPFPDTGRELLGMRAGEERSFTRRLEADNPLRIEGPREVEVRIKVLSLARRVVPPLDDEFAKRYGGVETLQEWKDKVRARLEEQRRETLREMRADAVISAILRANPIEIGDETVRRLAASTEDRVKERLLPGLPAEQREKISLGIAAERIESFTRERLARTLLLDAIARREGVEATPEELEEKLAEIAKENDIPLPQVRAAATPEVLERLRAQIRQEKTLDMLVRYAVVKPRVLDTESVTPAAAGPSLVVRPDGNEVMP